MISIISSVPTDLGFIDDCVGFFGAMVCVQVAKVGSFAVEVNDVDQINRVPDHSCGIHEVIGYFKTDQNYDLH